MIELLPKSYLPNINYDIKKVLHVCRRPTLRTLLFCSARIRQFIFPGSNFVPHTDFNKSLPPFQDVQSKTELTLFLNDHGGNQMNDIIRYTGEPEVHSYLIAVWPMGGFGRNVNNAHLPIPGVGSERVD